jgi:catechol 2,3-dioxygenase-like lactoylglutathione lyase family enzyme
MARAVPVLASSDLRATLEFYERRGFENVGDPPERWNYVIIARDGAELHFLGPPAGRRAPGTCFIWVDDADAVHAEWHPCIPPGGRLDARTDTEYGMRTFALLDPDGNAVHVGSRLRRAQCAATTASSSSPTRRRRTRRRAQG